MLWSRESQGQFGASMAREHAGAKRMCGPTNPVADNPYMGAFTKNAVTRTLSGSAVKWK